MKPSLLLRIAAFLLLIHLAGHTAGHLDWDEPKDPGMQDVVNSMKAHHADFMGASRSMADYFEGYSMMVFVVLSVNIVLLIMLSNFKDQLLIRQLLWPLGSGWILTGIIEYAQFFPFAALISGLAGLCIIAAVFSMPPKVTGEII